MSKPIRFLYVMFNIIFTLSAMKHFQDGETMNTVIDSLIVFANTMFLTFAGGDRK